MDLEYIHLSAEPEKTQFGVQMDKNNVILIFFDDWNVNYDVSCQLAENQDVIGEDNFCRMFLEKVKSYWK